MAQSVGRSPSSSSTSMRSHSVQLSMIFPAAMRLRVIPVSDLGSDARLLLSNLSEELLAVHRSKTVSSTVLTSSTLTWRPGKATRYKAALILIASGPRRSATSRW